MTTAPSTLDTTETLVDTVDLLARLSLAVSFLAEIRDDSVGSEKQRLAAKIDGIQTCARLIDKLAVGEPFPTLAEVIELVRRVDPGGRAVTVNLSPVELGQSKGCRLVRDYATNPGPR